MAQGTVKWFSNQKGYGFITPEGENEDGKDLFVHFSNVTGEGYKTLREGEKVEYEIGDGEKGKQAVNVSRVEGEQSQ